ncbi:malonic semialdehyde reductase [Brevundimonas sp. VNH65]|uniref:malonic semialdehyde reductase n=1 Tax=Brevundimonas sp. VNH65 TaxID=3400917 RepID=UPI003C0943DC
MAYDPSTRDAPLTDVALAQLFTEARTRNAWSDRPVAPELLHRLYDLTKFGPTAANTTPARFLFLASPEAKARLAPHMAEMNRAKTLQAPVNVVICHDLDFHEHTPFLFPHNPGAKDWFADAEGRKGTAMLNGSLQAGYFMIAARALGLDVGPMIGFDADGVKAEFLADTTWAPSFVINLGYGTDENLFPRSPRLDFDTAAKLL